MAAPSHRNVLEDLKFLHSGSWHFWYHTSSFKSTTILQRAIEPNQIVGLNPSTIFKPRNNARSHDVVALMKPAHVFTPAIFGDVVDEKLFGSEVVPSSYACRMFEVVKRRRDNRCAKERKSRSAATIVWEIKSNSSCIITDWILLQKNKNCFIAQYLLPCIPSFLTTVKTKVSTSWWGDDRKPDSVPVSNKLEKVSQFYRGKTDYNIHSENWLED